VLFLVPIIRSPAMILDDWGLSVLTATERRDLLEILEDRHGRGSTIVTSQLPVEHWHDAIGDPTLADAILDRLVHNAYPRGVTSFIRDCRRSATCSAVNLKPCRSGTRSAEMGYFGRRGSMPVILNVSRPVLNPRPKSPGDRPKASASASNRSCSGSRVRPSEVLDGPMNEDALEGFRLGQALGPRAPAHTAGSASPRAARANARGRDGHRLGCGTRSWRDAATGLFARPERKRPPLFRGARQTLRWR
jgi:hypothetical protein